MILHDLSPGTTLFRAHTPQWASRPTSGAGAASRGGRFNREGIEALYLSLDELTALREYQQTSPFLPPCTMCSYAVSLRGLVDLRQLHRGEPWDALWHDWREDWRHLKFELHIEPPTWVLGDIVLAHGYTGILFPSQAQAGGTNVVMYVSQLKDGNAVDVNNPDGRLPDDEASWARSSGASPGEGGLAETTRHVQPGCLAMAMHHTPCDESAATPLRRSTGRRRFRAGLVQPRRRPPFPSALQDGQERHAAQYPLAGFPGDFADDAQRLDVLFTGGAKPRLLLRLGGVEEPMSLAPLEDARDSAQGPSSP